jgi:hypothetical protein
MKLHSTTAVSDKIRAVITALFVAALLSSGVQSAQAAPRMLTLEQIASATPKVVVIDTNTGEVTEAWFGTSTTLTPRISIHNICNATDSCYVSGAVPYADQGFYGTAGTKTGSWPVRSQVLSKNRTVHACWTGGHCTPTLGPFTQAVLNPNVTGTSFTIH